MLKGSEWERLPLLSAAAPFKAGGRGGPDYYTDVPAGDVAIRNVADLYLYPNTVRAVAITGAQVREWLEMSAGIFNRIEPGKADQPLLDPAFPSYNFDVIDGITYRIDLSQPPRYSAKGELIVDAHASSTSSTTASRSTPPRNSWWSATTIAPAAAATSPASTARR
jgi:2',3'-cyclic-nucleotide 2'-phosphodiesterase/3'-nucleotidase